VEQGLGSEGLEGLFAQGSGHSAVHSSTDLNIVDSSGLSDNPQSVKT